jgi:trimeric autotransporter adhesin
VDSLGDVVTENFSEGIDTVQSSISWALGANLENLTLTGSNSINGTGNTLNNTLTGNAGNNILDGGAGNDTLIGKAGNDIYIVDSASDVIIELAGEGTDTVKSSISWILGDNLENLTLTGTAAINGTGNTLDNTLTGNAGNNILDGGLGNDTLIGGAGDDLYIVDSANDRITEQAGGGTDTVQSSVTWILGANLENLTLTGNSAINGTGNNLDNILIGNSAGNILDGRGGNDTLIGGIGNDTLLGGSGNDTLRGGKGNDILTGRNGSDRFVIARGEGTDTVTDFNRNTDKIGLADGLSFGQITISQGAGLNANNALISDSNNHELLAILSGVKANTLTNTMFITV